MAEYEVEIDDLSDIEVLEDLLVITLRMLGGLVAAIEEGNVVITHADMEEMKSFLLLERELDASRIDKTYFKELH